MLSHYAYRCSNFSSKSSKISFHKLPSKNKRPSIREQQLANIKRGGELPQEEHFLICSHHFDEDCFERDQKVSNVCIYTVRQRCFGNIGCSIKKILHCLSRNIQRKYLKYTNWELVSSEITILRFTGLVRMISFGVLFQELWPKRNGYFFLQNISLI